MSVNMQGLEWHGRQLRARRRVPERLVPFVGKKKLVKGLGTDNLTRANFLKRQPLAEFDTIIAKAEYDLELSLGSASSSVAVEAREYNLELQKALDDRAYGATFDERGLVEVDGVTFFRGMISDKAIELSETKGPADAALFYGIASGEATPLLHYVDDWLTEGGAKARQQGSYRTALRKFEHWLQANRKEPLIESVTPKIAGEYVTRAFVSKGANWKTTNKDVSACSSYWTWLKKRGHVGDNPWKGQSVRKRETPEDEQKRPFTDPEVISLFSGEPSSLLRDVMLVAALSGMRIDEIARIEARDVSPGSIRIREAKSKAGVRVVPIHSAIAPMIADRCSGKTERDAIFVPSPTTPIRGERSSFLSKQFTRYRRSLGVDDVAPGGRQSRIDFHSFRRWFARKAEDAFNEGATGFNPSTIAEVLGHSRQALPLGMTFRYAGNSPEAARRACVEAVHLPSTSKQTT